MTADDPEQCPVCGHEYDERQQHDSQAELRVPTHSGVCVQRFGTKLDVYLHKKLTIELATAPDGGWPEGDVEQYRQEVQDG